MGFGYYAVVLLAALMGAAAQGYIRSTYARWSQVPAGIGISGQDAARRMLNDGGAGSVGIEQISGTLTDHFDYTDGVLRLSSENFGRASVASVAVACHEAGHAVQAARGYLPWQIRKVMAPAIGLIQKGWFMVLIAGVVLQWFGLVQIAIALFAVSVLFNIVTLPVEIDASRRALKWLSANGAGLDEKGARAVLTAAALTYVAAALASLMQLVYLMSRYGGRSSR